MPPRKRYTEQDHYLWLLSKGVKIHGKAINPNSLPDLKVQSNAKLSNGIGNGAKRESKEYTGMQKHIVGLGYNKGNYIVLSAEDAKDPATGKRRC